MEYSCTGINLFAHLTTFADLVHTQVKWNLVVVAQNEKDRDCEANADTDQQVGQQDRDDGHQERNKLSHGLLEHFHVNRGAGQFPAYHEQDHGQ